MNRFSERFRAIVERIDTTALERGGTPTRALVVFNTGETAFCGRARFGAAFPMRREFCPQPVTIRDGQGRRTPSQITVSKVEARPDLPPGRVLWTMEIEFAVSEVPAYGWRTYAATFEKTLPLTEEEATQLGLLPLLAGPVVETECHSGDLPLTGAV